MPTRQDVEAKWFKQQEARALKLGAAARLKAALRWTVITVSNSYLVKDHILLVGCSYTLLTWLGLFSGKLLGCYSPVIMACHSSKSSSLLDGAAIEINASARLCIDSPRRLATPYSVIT